MTLGCGIEDHLSRLNNKEMVKGIPYLNFEKDRVCDACQLGKQTKSSFKSIKDILTSRPLELIHMDLFGPTQTKSLSENRFAFVLVDDFSRFTWVFFLEHKNQAFSHFQAFKKRVEKENDSSILRIRNDRGGEFINLPFITFCEEHGIKHELSCPRTPQQMESLRGKSYTTRDG